MSNPLLALLNRSGTKKEDENLNQNVPTSASNTHASISPPIASSTDSANSLLEALLKSPQQSNGGGSIISEKNNQQPSSPGQNIARDSAMQLMALLSPSASNSFPTSPQNVQPSNARSPIPTIFDQPNSFDLLNQPSKQRESFQTSNQSSSQTKLQTKQNGIISTNAETLSTPEKLKQGNNPIISSQKSTKSQSDLVNRKYLASSQLNKIHMQGNSKSNSNSKISTLQTENFGNCTMYKLNLLQSEPAGQDTLYRAKVEINKIAILKPPSSSADVITKSKSIPISARWSQKSVAAKSGSNFCSVCYITGKSKVRVIDEKTGNRAIIETDDLVRSIFVDKSIDASDSFNLGIVTASRIYIYQIQRLGQAEPSLILQIPAKSGHSFIYADFVFSNEKREVLVAQNDGSVSTIDIAPTNKSSTTLDNIAKTDLNLSTSENVLLAALATCKEELNFAAIQIQEKQKAQLVVHHVAQDKRNKSIPRFDMSIPTFLPVEEVSFAALIGDNQAFSIIGFNRNTKVAIVDHRESFKKVLQFDAGSNEHRNLLEWHDESSTLILYNSFRSSIFTIQFTDSNFEEKPSIKEYALSEIWTSFNIDSRLTEHGLRIAAFHSEGVQSITLPIKALQRSKDHKEVSRQVIPNATAEESKPDINTTSSVNGHSTGSVIDDKTLRDMFNNLEINLKNSITSTNSKAAPSSINGVGIGQDVVQTVSAQIQEIIKKDLARNVADIVSQTLPNELHNLFMRPDLTSHLTKSITSSIVPPIQKTAMDVVTKALAPHFEDVMNDLTNRIEAKIDQNMTSIRKDIVAEQAKALIESEAAIQKMSKQLVNLTNLVENMNKQSTKSDNNVNRPSTAALPSSLSASSFASIGMAQPSNAGFQTPQRSAIPSVTTPQNVLSPSALQQTANKNQSVEDALLNALSAKGENAAAALGDLLSQLQSGYGSPISCLANARGEPKVSQVVNLALLHRLIIALRNFATGATGQQILPEQSIPWIEACCSLCNRSDSNISRAFESVQKDMIDNLITAHQQLTASQRTPWWNHERFAIGMMNYLR